MIVTTGPMMIMGCSTYTNEKGKTYYNVDIYDANSAMMYNCSAKTEVYNQLANTAKPAQVKEMTLDVLKQYSSQSRLEVLGWK